MRKPIVTLCLTLAILFGKVVASEGADFKKGLNAYDRGDYVTALREWLPLAKQGNSDAQHKLGNMYYEGRGVLPNNKTAMDWWKRAAERGNEVSQNNLGYMIGSGFGSIKKRRNAVIKVKKNYPVKKVLTITRHGSSASSIWTEMILFSTNPAWKKIGVISDPVNKYQATRGIGPESEIVGFYDGVGGFYIDELTIRKGYEMVCNACRRWDVQTFKLIGQRLVRVNLRPFDLKSYERYSAGMEK
jgi:hypothetical protein